MVNERDRFKEYLPWFSPDESNEACEILEEIGEIAARLAEYAPLRRELRQQLSDKARACDDFLARVKRSRVERAVVMALETEAEKRKWPLSTLLSTILESYISNLTRTT